MKKLEGLIEIIVFYMKGLEVLMEIFVFHIEKA